MTIAPSNSAKTDRPLGYIEVEKPKNIPESLRDYASKRPELEMMYSRFLSERLSSLISTGRDDAPQIFSLTQVFCSVARVAIGYRERAGSLEGPFFRNSANRLTQLSADRTRASRRAS